jgi:hypothetical protein
MPYETIARHFFNFDRWLGIEPIGNGHINDTYRIGFEVEGRVQWWLLQRLNHHIFKQPDVVMENIRKVSIFLEKQAYPMQTTAPVAKLSGGLLHTDAQGNYWRIFPYIPDSYTPEGLVGPEIAFTAARAYGAFARALQHFPANNLSETIPGFHDTDRRWAALEEVLKTDPVGRVRSTAQEIAAIHEALPLFRQISHLKQSGALPVRVTHNDTKAGNVLLNMHTHQALAVIDLDTVMPGAILSDFGDMVRTCAPTAPEDNPEAVSLRPDIIAALEEGFLSETADWLLESEQKHLMLGAAWITGEQALRFLTDWLAGDVYYKIQYAEHNLVRTRNQLALFRAIVAKYA